MHTRQVSVNDRGIVRVQLAGLYDEVPQANGEARAQAATAAGSDVDHLYTVPASPPPGFDWCRDYIFGMASVVRPMRQPLLV